MEIFVYILSFISGGVVLTVAYNTYITSTIRGRYNTLLDFQKELEAVQKDQFHQTDKMVKELVANITATREAMQADNYKDLSGFNTELDNLKTSIGTVRNDLEQTIKLSSEEVKKIYSDIRQLNNKINSVREDRTLNQNY